MCAISNKIVKNEISFFYLFTFIYTTKFYYHSLILFKQNSIIIFLIQLWSKTRKLIHQTQTHLLRWGSHNTKSICTSSTLKTHHKYHFKEIILIPPHPMQFPTLPYMQQNSNLQQNLFNTFSSMPQTTTHTINTRYSAWNTTDR